MRDARKILLGFSIALMVGLPKGAHAGLSCQDYLRSAQLQDLEVLERAKAIAQPLIDAEQHFRVVMISQLKLSQPDFNELVLDNPLFNMIATSLLGKNAWMVFGGMDQLEADCRALPNDTVDAIVATRLKTLQLVQTRVEAQFAAEEEKAKARAAAEAQAEAARTQEKAAAEAAANRAGPPGSCKWKLEWMRETFGGRPEGNDGLRDSWREVWDWCAKHPNASAAELAAGRDFSTTGSEQPSKDTSALSADQRAAIGDYVRRCWTYDAGATGVDQFQVRLLVVTDENGTAYSAKVIGSDVARMKADPNFRLFAERAIRAVLDPTCATLPLPRDLLGQRRTLDFRFSP